MERLNNKYCYAIVGKQTGKLILIDGRLPLFWLRKVAVANIKVNPKHRKLIKINLTELEKFLNERSGIEP